jgi:signal transduction histidine kinase
MLAQTNNADEQKEYNRVIKENSNSMLKIVNDIVDFSKIETNTFTLNTDSFEVYDVLIQIEKEIGIENIKSLCINIDKIKRVIKTDKERFHQILYNLLNNAVRFTRKGSITLSIENDDNLLSFIIQDTGIGISPENGEKIFERFYKVDDFSGGAGLGLSISQSIARFMGGDIVLVDSKPGSGSVFKFTFPTV